MSRLKLDFSAAPWAAVTKARSNAQHTLDAAVRKEGQKERRECADTLTLSELLYRAVFEQPTTAS